MAIEVINIGTIANDGTGDDLREAFRKVNDNFENLDLRFPTAATGINLGSVGQGIYASAENSQLRFKKLVAGSNISLTANDNTITFDVPTTLDQLITITDSGTVIVQNGESQRLFSGPGLQITGDNSTKTITVTAGPGLLEQDTAPRLSMDLNANTYDISNAGNITANNFYGSLEGLVYGVDIRTISSAYTGFDFGNFSRTYDSAIELILGEVDADFGSFSLADTITVDLGSILV